MRTKEDAYIDLALKFKKEYEECKWWQFKKRIELYGLWQSALQMAMKYQTR